MPTLTRVRTLLVVFIIGLVLSGAAAIPLETETRLLAGLLHADWSPAPRHFPALVDWVDHMHQGFAETNQRYPFISYGTDWLAFAHFLIAVAFLGPLKDPVRNIWVVQFGMIACIAIIPYTAIAGAMRDIPLAWQLIDMSFGVVGLIPLLLAYRGILDLHPPTDTPTT